MAALPIIGAAMSVTGSLFETAGQIKGAKDAASQDLALAQAKGRQREQILKNAVRQERVLRIRGERTKGEQLAAFARGGVELSGSPLLALEETMRDVEEEAFAIREGAEFQRSQLLAEEEILKRSAQNRMRAAKLGAAATLLTGIGQAGMMAGMGATKPTTDPKFGGGGGGPFSGGVGTGPATGPFSASNPAGS